MNHLLDDVEDSFVGVDPQVVVGYGHGLKRDLFGVLEIRVGPPDALQPVHVEQPVANSSSFHYCVVCESYLWRTGVTKLQHPIQSNRAD